MLIIHVVYYIFFAINDVTVTSVNTYKSMMGLSTKVLDQIFARK